MSRQVPQQYLRSLCAARDASFAKYPDARLASSGVEGTTVNYDFDDDDDDYNKDSPLVYTRPKILDELLNDAIIYSGNSSPGQS